MGYDAAKLLLRCCVAVLMLFHGAAKVIHGIGPIVGLVTKAGLPAWISYGVYVGEIVGPILLIVGLRSRLGAGLVMVNILACIALSHAGELLKLSPLGGWALELDALYLLPCLIILLAGGGRYAASTRSRLD
jgi:putative oxidoreductase